MRRPHLVTALLAVLAVACGGADVPESLQRAAVDWETDFSISSIDLAELVVGVPAGDPRDVVAPLDDPTLQTTAEADAWLSGDEPGVLVEVEGVGRFYPLRILSRHEVINDRIGDAPLLVTYCPLCNSAVVFDPTVGGAPLRFGTSGLLRRSDLVLWDEATESLWQQLTGEAIVGELTATRLRRIPSAIIRWRDFADRYADGRVLGRNQGRKVLYGDNPYPGYSRRQGPLDTYFDGEIDPRLPPLERVVGVSHAGQDAAVPFSLVRARKAMHLQVGGDPVVVFWGAASTTDALDGFTVPGGEAIGSALAFAPEHDGVRLTFEPIGIDRFRDDQTGSEWSLLGEAVDGPLEGARLDMVVHTNEFWFAWQAFNDPDGLTTG